MILLRMMMILLRMMMILLRMKTRKKNMKMRRSVPALQAIYQEKGFAERSVVNVDKDKPIRK